MTPGFHWWLSDDYRLRLRLRLEFTESYPNKPPSVRFTSKMFHPNGKTNEKIFFVSSSSSFSLCWRWNLFGYSSKSLVTNLWCFSDSYIDSSRKNRFMFLFIKEIFTSSFSRSSMNQMFHHQQILKPHIFINQIDVNMNDVYEWRWNKVGLLNLH